MNNNFSIFCSSISLLHWATDQVYQYQNKKDDENRETCLDYVLDITIAYPEGKPLDILTIITGVRPPCKTHFFYRLYHSSEVGYL